MNARHDALAHRFIAFTQDETREWPAELRVDFHELAFKTLPELILELDEPAACRFARAWRQRIEALLAAPAVEPFSAAERAWLAELAGSHATAGHEVPCSSGEVTRLAELLRRVGPIALALPWRDVAPAKA